MNYSLRDISKEKELILDLYKDGIVKVSNLFDHSFLKELKSAKDRIFSLYPYGQNDNYEKILDFDQATKTGYYPIKNLLELDPIFRKLLEDRNINFMAEEILGKEFYFTNMNMRIVPKTNTIMETHRDFCGGLSFSLLLDNISIDQGETFFFKDSYKNPPPPFANLKNFSANITPTIGELGDTYFWFAESWHGRNHNLSDKETCILMADIQNRNTDQKIIQIYGDNKNKTQNLLNKTFKLIGNDPNHLLKNLFYFLLRFKILKKKIEKEEIIYTRLVLKNSFSVNFSFFSYFKKIDFIKLLKISISKTIKLIIGKKFFAKLKKILLALLASNYFNNKR